MVLDYKTIIIASDHTGCLLKEKIINFLNKYYKYNIQLIDLGVDSQNKESNYAQIGIKLATKIANNQQKTLGIAICGTGIGISIACNKVQNVRCALIYNTKTAKLAKQHNNANIIAFGARQFCYYKVIKYLKIFLNSNFEKGRHIKRIQTICEYENDKLK